MKVYNNAYILIPKGIGGIALKDISIKIGNRIRYFRVMKELSQERLALEAGLNPAFLGHIERGLKCPTIDTLSKIATALNITLSELVNIEPEVSTNNYTIDKIITSMKSLSQDDAERVAHIVSEIAKINRNQ